MKTTTGTRLLSVAALVVAGTAALPLTSAGAATSTATLIRSTSTAAWGTPSPDPAGIAYDAARDRLVISDSEVDEMPLYRGTNVFFSSRSGAQTAGNVGWTTLPWSDEAAGISYVNPSLTLVSDDDSDRIYFVPTAASGLPTSSNTPPSFSTRPENGDPEDVTVDADTTSNGHVLIIDGHNSDVVEYAPGPNGRFDGPGSDDVRTVYDVGQYGALDPEGIKYHPQRNTVLVLDSASRSVYEIDRSGGLLNVVDISAATPKSAAGITLAPASNGSGALHAYIVDRGVDNDSNPQENDGRLSEVDLRLPPLGGGTNVAPAVSAGPDQTVTLPAAATLSGTVTDDGRPAPPAATTVTWSRVSGPGTVTFAQSNSASTTASFSAAGTYVLRLTATDSALSAFDEVAVTVATGQQGGGTALDIPVRAGSDDAEERSASVLLTSGDLNLVTDGTTVQTVGLRFTGVTVPRGATITDAYLQFRADETTTTPTTLTIAGQAADNAATFAAVARDVSARPRTAATASWSPAAWTAGATGADQRSPGLAPVVQEIVNRTGWVSGNAIALVVTGSGQRIAESFEGGAARAPVLHLEYTGGTTTTNAAPTVNAGPDTAVVRPAAATLQGSVSDDGRPAGSTLTSTWTRVSGPGTVTFASPGSPSTTATFSAAGSYVLRLSGSDGALTSTDDVTVQVDDGGTTGVVDVPVRAGADDAEEVPSGAVALGSGDLNLVTDGTRVQTVGLRFTGVAVPAGARITRAWVQFQADEVSTTACTLTIAGQASANAPAFTTTARDVSARQRTAATVSWSPAAWPTAGARGAEQRTPDLSAVLAQVVAAPGWASGNAVVLVVTGTGSRVAEAFEGGAARAPVLHVEFTS